MFKLNSIKLSKKSSFLSHRRGLTLLEMLVVITIIGLLASIIVVGLSETRPKARDTKRKADVKTLRTAIEWYANNNKGSYPVLASGSVANLATPLLPYLQTIPDDPLSTKDYIYQGTSTAYGLRIEFESIAYGAGKTCETGVNISTLSGWGTYPTCGF